MFFMLYYKAASHFELCSSLTIRLKTQDTRPGKRGIFTQFSPLAQSVSKNASKMNSTIFRALMLSKDNLVFPKSGKDVVPLTWITHR